MQIMDIDEDLSSICDSTVSSGVHLPVPAGNRQLSVTPLGRIFLHPGIFDRGLSTAGPDERDG